MHWTGFFASNARADALIEGHTDPVSGQPELKITPVSVAHYPAAWHGFAVSEREPPKDLLDYWAVARTKAGFRLEMAGLCPCCLLVHACPCVVLSLKEGADMLAYHDAGAGHYRFAAFKDSRLTGALFIARGPVPVSRSWACEQLGQAVPEARGRLRILAGRLAAGAEDFGAIVCSCFEVGANQIAAAVAA